MLRCVGALSVRTIPPLLAACLAEYLGIQHH